MRTFRERTAYNLPRLGDQFGKWTVIELPFSKRCGTWQDKIWFVRCRCECGREKEIRTSTLKYIAHKHNRGHQCRSNKPRKPSKPRIANPRILITFRGRTLSQTQWAKELGISRQRVSQRLANRSIEEAIGPYLDKRIVSWCDVYQTLSMEN